MSHSYDQGYWNKFQSKLIFVAFKIECCDYLTEMRQFLLYISLAH